MKEGDYIVGLNEHDVKWSPHDEVVTLIKASGHSLKLKVVTPMSASSAAQASQKRDKVCSLYFWTDWVSTKLEIFSQH